LSPLPEGWSDDPKNLPPNHEFVDPKDLPYLYASQELGLPVFTSDRHLGKMAAPVLWVCIDTTCRDHVRTDTAACGHARFDEACRDHARSTSVTIGFTLGSTFTVTIGVETLQAAVRGIKNLFDCFRRQPAWLQLLVTGVLAAIMIHPKSRAKLVQACESAWATASQAKGPVFEGILDMIQQLGAAQSDAAKTLSQIQAAIPPTHKATALVLARRICAESRGLVPIDDIVRKMRKEGYSARAKYPEVYLRRVMRESGQFIEVAPRMFELRA
jgi:hypothetical protein